MPFFMHQIGYEFLQSFEFEHFRKMTGNYELRITFSKIFAALNLFLFAAFVFGMVIYPFLNGGHKNAHQVWYEWQSLNGGLLAYLAAILVYMAARVDIERKEIRTSKADRAALSRALSIASTYLSDCGKFLSMSLSECKFDEDGTVSYPYMPISYPVPVMPDEFYQICYPAIASANLEISDHLSKTLQDLQIFHSRICAINKMHDDKYLIFDRQNFISHLADAAIIMRNINALFSYGRFRSEKIDLQGIGVAISNLNINFDLELDVGYYCEEFLSERNYISDY